MDTDGTPYITSWLVALDAVQLFIDEHCCFCLGDSVEFKGYETFEIPTDSYLPNIIKRS